MREGTTDERDQVPDNPIRFRAKYDLIMFYLAARYDGESLSSTARRDLWRYYGLLDHITPRFADAGAVLLIEVIRDQGPSEVGARLP